MAWAELSESGDLTQGSIVDQVNWGYSDPDESPLGIILTNPCDFENDKASFILIAALVPAVDVLQISKEYKEKIDGHEQEQPLSKSKSTSLFKFFTAYIHNVNITRYFFLDPKKALEAPYFLVDFQRTITIPFDEKERLKVVGLLNSPFREKMIMHYSSYVSRIGVDRIDRDQLKAICQELSLPIFLTLDD